MPQHEGAETRKQLGWGDLLAFTLSTGVSLRWLPVAAVAGPSAITLWLIAWIGFYIPSVLATAELTSRVEGEGGIYAWSNTTLGKFWGFLTGWIYWAANLPYLPGVLYFSASLVLFMQGYDEAALAESKNAFLIIASIAMIAVACLHIFGMRYAKWLANIGAISTWIVFAILLIAAISVLTSGGSGHAFTAASFIPDFSQNNALLWASLVFALQGAESVAFMRGEVRGGIPAILKALTWGGVGITCCYLLGTVAILILLPAEQVSGLGGLPQAIAAASARMGVPDLTPWIVGLLLLSSLGSLSSWYAASARLPFAAGIDSYLPQSFGKSHPRFGSPYVALIFQAVLVLIFLFLSQAGASVKTAYDFMIAMGVLTYTLPYVLMFIAFLVLRKQPGGPGIWKAPGGVLVGVVGLIITIAAIILSAVPPTSDPAPMQTFMKLMVASIALILIGVGFYAYKNRGQKD
jgi:glutamate:GABA antiporter